MQSVFPELLLHSRWHARSMDYTGESNSCSHYFRPELSLERCLKPSQKERSGERPSRGSEQYPPSQGSMKQH